MALTLQQRKELMDVVARTGGHRETMLSTRVIPENYRSCQNQCSREELTLDFPGLMPLRTIVTRSKHQKEGAPLHVNYHGGGFVAKQDADDDMYCARLAAVSGAVVVDIDYAVSTEASFPMAFDQSYEAAKWAFAHCEEWGCDPARFSIGGSSAGGNLAAAVAIKVSKTKEFPLALLVMAYAASDLYQAIEDPAQERSAAFSRLYADGDVEKLKDPLVSPAYAGLDDLKGMPRTLIIAPKNCPFYPINNALGMRMVDAGVEVTFHAYPDAPHGFTVRMAGDDWLRSQDDIIRAIQIARL